MHQTVSWQTDPVVQIQLTTYTAPATNSSKSSPSRLPANRAGEDLTFSSRLLGQSVSADPEARGDRRHPLVPCRGMASSAALSDPGAASERN